MGDIADMMIEGILCECCGEYIGNSVGYPRKCSYCMGESYEKNKKKHKFNKKRKSKIK